MANGVSDISAQLLNAAASQPVPDVGVSLATILAEALAVPDIEIWHFPANAVEAVCYGGFGTKSATSGVTMTAAATRLLRRLANNESASTVDYSTLGQLGAPRHSSTRHGDSALLVPLHSGDRCVGALLGETPEPGSAESNEMLAVAERLAGVVAFAIEHVELRRSSRLDWHASPELLDDLPLQVIAVDREGIFVYANREFSRRWGDQQRDRFVGRHYSHFISLFRRESVDGVAVQLDGHPLTRAMRGESVSDALHLVPTHFDTPKVFALTTRPTYDPSGSLSGAVMITRDATSEFGDGNDGASPLDLLTEARHKVELLADLTTEIGQRRGADEVFRIVAERSTAVLGADACAVLTPGVDNHMNVRAVHNMPPDSEGRTLNKLRVPSMMMALEHQELIHATRDDASQPGQELLEEAGMDGALFVPLVDEERALGVLIALYSDKERIHSVDPSLALAIGRQCGHAVQLRNVAVELESAHGRLAAVLDQLPQAVLIIDGQSETISAVNQDAETLWGTRSNLLDHPAAGIVFLDLDDEPLVAEQHPFTRSLHSKNTELGVALKTLDLDGEIVDVVANIAPISGASGGLQGVVALLQRREHFKPIDEAKDEFISVVAHELRNPLTSLRGNLQLLSRRMDRDGEFDPAIERGRVNGVIEQVDRVSDLVSRMLDVSRADVGKLTIAPESTDAMKLVRRAITDVEGQSGDRNILLDGPDAVPVQWDPVRVAQVLVNLLSNAVRYAPTGDIQVNVTATDDNVRISVRDHGAGVPPRLRRRLFRLYYRFDDGEETEDGLAGRQQGLGIGLYISARLAKAHGGELTVNNADGGGATFTLALPAIADCR